MLYLIIAVSIVGFLIGKWVGLLIGLVFFTLILPHIIEFYEEKFHRESPKNKDKM